MNKKLSGAQTVLVPIRQVGKNYIPFTENLRNRYIKFIDAVPATYLPDTDVQGVQNFAGMYITVSDKVGNMRLMQDLPLARLNYKETYGQRQQVASEISLQNSYITVTNANYVGRMVVLVFWYDLPEYSARNTTDSVLVDGLTVNIASAAFHNMMPDSLTMAGKRFRQVLFNNVYTTPDYTPGVTDTEAGALYLTLRKGSYNVLENVPVALLHQLVQADKICFANIIFDFQSSYITVGGAGTYTSPVGKSVYFNFAYEK